MIYINSLSKLCLRRDSLSNAVGPPGEWLVNVGQNFLYRFYNLVTVGEIKPLLCANFIHLITVAFAGLIP